MLSKKINSSRILQSFLKAAHRIPILCHPTPHHRQALPLPPSGMPPPPSPLVDDCHVPPPDSSTLTSRPWQLNCSTRTRRSTATASAVKQPSPLPHCHQCHCAAAATTTKLPQPLCCQSFCHRCHAATTTFKLLPLPLCCRSPCCQAATSTTATAIALWHHCNRCRRYAVAAAKLLPPSC